MIFELEIVHNLQEAFIDEGTRIWSGNDNGIEIRGIGCRKYGSRKEASK